MDYFSSLQNDDDMLLEIPDYLSCAQDHSPEEQEEHTVFIQRNPYDHLRQVNDAGDNGVEYNIKNGKQAIIRETTKGSRSNKVAFRTKSELDILDDGYKWKKYGKKMVKNSPNPRNYYRCSSVGCDVKKRVEREVEDPRFVITTYEGVHNHHVPLPVSAAAQRRSAIDPFTRL